VALFKSFAFEILGRNRSRCDGVDTDGGAQQTAAVQELLRHQLSLLHSVRQQIWQKAVRRDARQLQTRLPGDALAVGERHGS
jgi:hypothetical protein